MNYKKLIELAKELEIEEIEIISRKTESKEIELFDGQVDKNVTSSLETCSIRGAYKGKLARVSTENLSDKSAREVLELLKDNCTSITSDEPYVIYEGSKRYPKIKRVAKDFSLISSKVKLDDLYRLNDLIKNLDSRITNVNLGYSEEKETTRLINSKGLDLKKSYSYGVFTCSAVMKDEDDVRDEFGYQIKLDYDDFNIDELAKNVVTRLQKQLHPVQIESKSYPVILENKMVISLLGAFTSMFSSESALRNMTLLKGKEGEKIASELITLVDDPLYEKGVFQHSFDNQGVACYKKALIEKGVFKTLLYDLKTAMMFNTIPTGNSFGGISPTNLCLECGDTSLEDMAKTIDDGLLITSLAGLHSGLNPVSGDFSAQASGFRIENGKVTYPVSLIVVSGNFLKLLQDVEIVGNDEFISYNGVSAPSLKISKLSISGK